MHIRSAAFFIATLAAAAGAASAAEFDFDAYQARLPWIWKAPQRPAIPAVQGEWAIDDIDRFVLANLQADEMSPAADAEPLVWLRRAHFAITGLPPARDEQARFLSDRAPGRRQRAARALLESPHYGERWARHWMDLMRFAESRGHETDFIIANAWRYRDYLIRAFNTDLPYNQFVREHIAGDLLLQPRLDPETGANESVLATGWPFFGEEVHSPVDIRQDECDRTDNKIDVFGKAFLGLTISCARCHDHKFDAIRQSDYYALSGFVASSSYRQVRYESVEHNRRIARELDALREKYRPIALKEIAERGRPIVEKVAGTVKGSLAVRAPSGARTVADYSLPGQTAWRTDGPAFGLDVIRRGQVVLGSDANAPALEIAGYGAARRDRYWDSLKVVDSENDSGSLDATSRAGKTLRTPTVTLAPGKLHYLIRGKTKVYVSVGQHLMVTGPLHQTLVQEFHVGGHTPNWVTHDLTAYAGMRAHIEFGPVGNEPLDILAVVDADSVLPQETDGVEFDRAHLEDALGAMVDGRPLPSYLLDAVDWIAKKTEFNVADIAGGEYLEALAELRNRTRWESRTAVAWADNNGIDEPTLDRGSPKTPLDPAPRGLPEAFGNRKIRSPESSGRMELARQLTYPDNPLLARVIVNRVWHQLFGRGIVGTVDNFGWLGERPTHPELLDYLAAEFIDAHGWSIKSLVERLVLTRTFAMSSTARDPGFDERDPDNLLLHRMPVRRLEAEAIRDSALTISGRLDRAVGGKPVPVHLNEFVIGRGRPEQSGPLDGAGRRSIYTAVRRNFLPTLMLAFDYPTPFSTVGNRDVTNVPAQSLALMNDPFLYQQAGVWADRVLKEGKDLPALDRVRQMFETAFARRASDAEVAGCLESLGEFASLYGGDLNSRDAWRDLCHALFSLNDFIYLK